MQEIKNKQETKSQSILNLLWLEGPLSAGEIGWELEVSPEIVDCLLARLSREKKVKTTDGIFWELGEDAWLMGDDRPELIVLCGPSHAGKTTFAKRFCRYFTVISSDEIRRRLPGGLEGCKDEGKVWSFFESAKRMALKVGHNVVLDACHISKEAIWHSLQGPNSRHRKICVVFDLPLRTVRERCVNKKRVPLKKVERMWRDFQKNKPTSEELKRQGFEEIYYVKG